MKQCWRPECKADLSNFTEGGVKRHFTTNHGGSYTDEDLIKSGFTPSNPVARTADSGRSNIGETVSAAPERETTKEETKGKKEPKQTQEDKDRDRLIALRPSLVKQWERRLKTPYLIFSKMLDDPSIALSPEEALTGAEMHADLMIELGWARAGKMLAIFDVGAWHLATFVSRSQWGRELLASMGESEKKPSDTNVN